MADGSIGATEADALDIESPERYYTIVQFETHDERLAAMFQDRSSPVPEFGKHDVTPTREFNFLNSLRGGAEKILTEPTEDGSGIKVTLAVNEFGADDAGSMSAMTHGSSDPKRPLLDSFRYRGSGHDFQRVSIHGGQRSSVERLGQDVEELIALDL